MLRLNMDESEALRERYQACRRWTTQIHNDLLRRTSLRKAKATKLSVSDVQALVAEAVQLQLEAVEISQAQDRVGEALRWSTEAQAVLRPLAPVTPSVLHLLKDLTKRAEELNLALEEQEELDARLGYAVDWLARAKSAMDSNAGWRRLTRLVKEARASQLELPEVSLLAEAQAEQAWLGQAEMALNGVATPDELSDLVVQSARMAETSTRAVSQVHFSCGPQCSLNVNVCVWKRTVGDLPLESVKRALSATSTPH